jgi:hypothetical protein
MKLFWKTGLLTIATCSSLLGAAQKISAEQNKQLIQTAQGRMVSLEGFLTENMPTIEYQKVIMPGPQYIISDDPEYIRVPEAIAVKEQVQPGSVRLYVYNVNGVKEPEKMDRRIMALIRNTSQQPLRLRTNYFLCGKKGLADYFASEAEKNVRIIKPGEVVAIDPRHEKAVVQYDELVHGIYEFVIDQPAEISVVQTDLKSTGAQVLARTTSVLNSRHTNAGRGLFGVSNYLVIGKDTLNTEGDAKALVLADGKSDPWINGKDAATGQVAKLSGNYGVMYDVELKWKSTNGKGLALVTWNARAGGKWCGGMANTMVVSGGKFKEGIIQLPSNQLTTKGPPEAILIQVFPPAADGAVQTICLKYSPPGASCLPTPLIFVPVDLQ